MSRGFLNGLAAGVVCMLVVGGAPLALAGSGVGGVS